jgi:hypothetical protein
MTTTPAPKEAVMFTAESYPLPTGTALPDGRTVEGLTLTAYRVTGGGFVPFVRVHQSRPVEPLVRWTR